MINLDDDVLLCVFSHCDLDTFLASRLLSRSVLELITRNMRMLCEKVADNTFRGQQELFRECRAESGPDLSWLRRLRVRQLAAIFVECASPVSRSRSMKAFNAEDRKGQYRRESIENAFKVLGQFQRITADVNTWPEDKLPEDPSFILPDFSSDVRDSKPDGIVELIRVLTMAVLNYHYPNGLYDAPPRVGISELSPVPFTPAMIASWRRRWVTLREQINYMRQGYGGPYKKDLRDFAAALVNEFKGGPPYSGGLQSSLLSSEVKAWDDTASPVRNTLENPFHWVWSSIVESGPEAFWREWSGSSRVRISIVESLAALWEQETLEVKMTKALVGQAFFISLERIARSRPYRSCGGWGRICRLPREISLPPKTFPNLCLNLMIMPQQFRLCLEEVTANKPSKLWYEVGAGEFST